LISNVKNYTNYLHLKKNSQNRTSLSKVIAFNAVFYNKSITVERGHFEHEFLDNPLDISKTTFGKDDPYKGPLIPPIGFWIPEKSIFDN
jgi:hypothetical protein